MFKKLLVLSLCAIILSLPSVALAKNNTISQSSFGSGCNVWKFFVTATDLDGYTETFGPYADWAAAEAAQTRILNSNWRITDAYIHEEEYCF